MTTCQCEWKTNFSQTDPTNPQARYNAGWTTEMCMDSCIKGQDDCNAQPTDNLLAGQYYVFDAVHCSCVIESERVSEEQCEGGWRAEVGALLIPADASPTPRECLIKQSGADTEGIGSSNSVLKAASGSSASSSGLNFADPYIAERCAYRALPDFEGDACQCNLASELCDIATPYFDPTECECVCPLSQADCKAGFTFNPATCSCFCQTDKCTTPAFPHLKRGDGVCDCTCNLNKGKCPQSTPMFHPENCSCKCDLVAADCTNPAKNPAYKTAPNFDSATCSCVKKLK